jgi:hypothetical protein
MGVVDRVPKAFAVYREETGEGMTSDVVQPTLPAKRTDHATSWIFAIGG